MTMHNPTYLGLSRHNVYYFRWPIPASLGIQSTRHIRLSLRTRCPREALRLARVLEYTGYALSTSSCWIDMDHVDIVSILKGHFASVLETMKARLDRSGPLPAQNVLNIQKQLSVISMAIDENRVELYDDMFGEGEMPQEHSINIPLNNILSKFELHLEPGTPDHETFRQEFRFALRNYFKDLLQYNAQIRDYSLLTPSAIGNPAPLVRRPENRLQVISAKYVDEMKRGGAWGIRALEEREACLAYLMEFLGSDYDLLQLDGRTARSVKDALIATPLNRSKNKLTRDLSLKDQLVVGGVPKLANGSINKYLQCYSSMCIWAVQNQYIKSNPFAGMKLSDTKRGKRQAFTKDQISIMLVEAEKLSLGLCNTDLKYWGTLITIFTGARLNEIASLTPDDVKQDHASQIYYIEITDDEEAHKKIKTEASRRIVPVHSYLLDRGFLAFVERQAQSNSVTGYTRLLPGSTLSLKEGWGRNFGRFFNARLLPKLSLKSKKLTLHSLRHSFITSLSVAGIDSVSIKSMVGHEQGTVTAEVYTHFGVDHLSQFQKAIESLGYTQLEGIMKG